MARHEFSTRSKPTPDPVEIVLDGTTFTCRAQVPGTVLLGHVERLSDGQTAAAELLRIWEDVFDHTRETEPALDENGEPILDENGEPILDEIPGTSEHDRFRAYVDDPTNTVDVQDLGEILQAVLGDLSGRRPTTSSSRSAPGRSATGTTSRSATSGLPRPVPARSPN